jgi:peptide methionine sulfoxide reductase MsrA
MVAPGLFVNAALALAALASPPRAGPLAVCGRRAALAHAAAATASALLAPAHAADNAPAEASAFFTAGDARFLQPAFDDIRYLGVRSTLVGSLHAADGAELPALLVSYDPAKLTYKRLLGAFWRGHDPTRSAAQGQFGSAGPSVIWASSEAELKTAQESRRRLEASGLFRGRAIETEVRAIDRGGALDSRLWTAAADSEQEWYRRQPQAYDKLRAQSGRSGWFERTYRPIKTTACEDNVCGYVYFPCSDENGCSAVMQGKW